MMDQKPPIDITLQHWQMVKEILDNNVPEYDVYAFGSRVTGKARPYSDLDLVIMTERPLGIKKSASLSGDFSESDLPWKVDVIDWATTSESFRKIIEEKKVLLKKVTA